MSATVLPALVRGLTLGFLLALPTLAVGCASEINIDELDTSCSFDEECVAVYVGQGCGGCQCANAAIHEDALPEYTARRDAVSCEEVPSCACAAPLVACSEGTCVAR